MDLEDEYESIQGKVRVIFWVALTMAVAFGSVLLTAMILGVRWLWNHV